MDNERAKFILRNFRPDGADSDDEDFAEALRLATSDRELGEWLMRERAFDAEFAESLARVKLPDGLRESVLLAMLQDGEGNPRVDLEGEVQMMKAMEAIEVPDGLRERVLEAMEQSARKPKKVTAWFRYGFPLAAAAGIVFGFVLLNEREPGNGGIAHVEKLPVEAVPVGFLSTFEAASFDLEKKSKNAEELISYLKEKGLPYVEGVLPPGLEGVEGMGCRELIIEGKLGSLVCFHTEKGLVHLVIFQRKDLEGELSGMESPLIKQDGSWARAQWENGQYVYTMLSQCDEKVLAAFF